MNLSESYKTKMQKLAAIEPTLLKEEKKTSPIDMDKLFKFADAIEVLCNGEYGVVFYNEDTYKVFVMLGDSNPFDTENLTQHIKEILAKNYNLEKEVDVEIGYESYREGEEWKEVYNGKLKDTGRY